MATTATTAPSTTTPSTQGSSSSSSSSKKKKNNESRLNAIQQLLDRYRQEQIKNSSSGIGSGIGSGGGYYVHPALHYETDEWGGVAAQVSQPVTSGTILLVIPEMERLSFRTIGPLLEPQSLFTYYLPAIKKECEASSSLKESLHCDVVALLIMYLWKNNGTTTTTTTTTASTRSESETGKNGATTTTTTTTNLDLFLQTWPSSEELKHLYLQPKDRQPWLQGTYAEYYLQQRTKADGMILDAIFKVFRGTKKNSNDDDDDDDDDDSQLSYLLSRFSDDITRAGFAKVFSLAWKIVDSRSHDGLRQKRTMKMKNGICDDCVCFCVYECRFKKWVAFYQAFLL
jgi:hypothetical protein